MILDSHTLQPVHFPTLSIFVHQDIPCPRLSNPMFERHRRPRDPKGRWWSGMAGHIISRRTVILRRQARQAPHPPFRNLLFQSYHHLPQTALGRRQHRLVSRVSHRIRHRLHLGSCIVLPDLNRRCPWTRVDLDCSLSPCLRRRKSNMVSPWSWLLHLGAYNHVQKSTIGQVRPCRSHLSVSRRKASQYKHLGLSLPHPQLLLSSNIHPNRLDQ